MPRNQQILLDNRPEGEAAVSNFKLVETETPALQEGQVLVRHHYLSLDPYMRGRMNDGKSYAAPQPLGEVMLGGTGGEVVESRHAKFQPGDKVVGMGGWQLYSISRWSPEDGRRLRRHLEIEFEEKQNRQIYWDDIALFCYPEEYRLGIRPMHKGDVIEVDDLSELAALDASYRKYEKEKNNGNG